MFFRLPSGEVFQDDTICPRPEDVEWAQLFKVDAAPVYCIAPIFPDAAAAVRWLRSVVHEKRKYPWYTRKRGPDFAAEIPTGALGIAELGLGAIDNYGELISQDAFLIPTFLYRGQENMQYPFLPTLARCLWPPIGLGKGSFDDARQTLSSEEKCTNYFTSKFFKDPSLRSRFDWLAGISVPRRAAIARHHGFYSWILDFTLDAGIAAWFATGGAAKKAPSNGLGMIQVIDEHRLTQIFRNESWIINYAGYQQRSWSGVNAVEMDTVLKNTSVLMGTKQIGTLVDGEWWMQLKSRRRALDKFCCDLYFTPGLEVTRMWQQKWCGLEATCEKMSLAEVVTAYQVLARIVDCVLFRHNGSVYEEPDAEITYEHLLPSNDDFSLAVEEYQREHGLKPGSFTRAFLGSLGGQVMNDADRRLLAQAQESYKQARAYGKSIETLDLAIDGFRDVAAKSEALNQPLASAIALIDLGAQLVNRAWTPPNLVNLQDAAEAEDVLSRAFELLSQISDPLRPSLEANALAWRARARTFLAEKDLNENELAIDDAKRAIDILTAQTGGLSNMHDLAIAHLHMARAYFFRAASMKSFWRLLGGKRQRDIQEVRRHAAEALRLDPTDRHINVQGSWLLENADKV